MLNYYLINYGLPVVSFLQNIYKEISYYTNLIMKVPKMNELLFFENNPSAYLSSFVDENNNNSGVVVWRYNLYYNLFYSYSCMLKDTKHFPILSGSLICDDEKINLDNFFEEIKVESSNPNYPSVQQIIEVISYKYGYVFDRTKNWKLNYLDNNVNEFTLDIFKDSWNFTAN